MQTTGPWPSDYEPPGTTSKTICTNCGRTRGDHAWKNLACGSKDDKYNWSTANFFTIGQPKKRKLLLC